MRCVWWWSALQSCLVDKNEHNNWQLLHISSKQTYVVITSDSLVDNELTGSCIITPTVFKMLIIEADVLIIKYSLLFCFLGLFNDVYSMNCLIPSTWMHASDKKILQIF